MTSGNACIVAPGVEQTVFSCADEDIVLNLLIRRSTFAESFWELLESNDGGVIADFFWKMLYHKPGGEVLLFNSRPDMLLEESVMDLYGASAAAAGEKRPGHEEYDDGHICLYSQMEGKGRGMAQKKEKQGVSPGTVSAVHEGAY